VRKALAPILALLPLAGCAGLLDRPAAAPANAPAEMREVRFAVDDRVAIVTEGTIGSAFDQTLRGALEAELVRAGLALAGPAEVTIHLEARVAGAPGVLRGRGSLTLEHAGEELDSLASEEETVRASEFPEALARRLVGLLVDSPRLRSYLARRGPDAPPAGAPPPADAVALARQHARQGTALYNLDRFGPALAEYEAAYLAAPDPALLYNIGQCQRRLGRRGEALDYYRKYLRAAPRAGNREEVERHIRELESTAQAARARR
jgi:tetratricopeptide (TPR) repeat protein